MYSIVLPIIYCIVKLLIVIIEEINVAILQ